MTTDTISPIQARTYLRQTRGWFVGETTMYRWLNRGALKGKRDRTRGFWWTTYDWVDEAVMWHRIPLRRGRPRDAPET